MAQTSNSTCQPRSRALRSPEFEANDSPLMAKDGFAVDQVICPEANRHRLHPQADRIPRSACRCCALRAWPGQPDRGACGSRRAAGAAQRWPRSTKLVPGVDDAHRGHLPPGHRAAGSWKAAPASNPATRCLCWPPRNTSAPCWARCARCDRPVKRVMIAGGGKHRACAWRASCEGSYQIKIIEPAARALRLPGHPAGWPTCLDPARRFSTDEDLLGDENVQDMDLFLALTSDDEDNIMACLLAKRLGAQARAGGDQPPRLRRPGARHAPSTSPSAPAHTVHGRAAGLCAPR